MYFRAVLGHMPKHRSTVRACASCVCVRMRACMSGCPPSSPPAQDLMVPVREGEKERECVCVPNAHNLLPSPTNVAFVCILVRAAINIHPQMHESANQTHTHEHVIHKNLSVPLRTQGASLKAGRVGFILVRWHEAGSLVRV